MSNKILLAKGPVQSCPDEYTEVINGVEYKKCELSDYEKDAVRCLYAAADKYKLTHRPLDTICKPYSPLEFQEMENTILKPELAVIVNGKTFPEWIVEVVPHDTDVIAYLLKTELYFNAGVREYWIVNPEKQYLMVYFFEETGLKPMIYDSARRIKVSIYKDMFVSYSDIFKRRNEEEK